MARSTVNSALLRGLSDYGMLAALLLLCAFFSYATWDAQHPVGADAGERLGERIVARFGAGADRHVLIVARASEQDAAFAETLRGLLARSGYRHVEVVRGTPRDARELLARRAGAGGRLDVIAGTHATAAWEVFDNLPRDFPPFAAAEVLAPEPAWWPTFLTRDNLLNVTIQIVVIAILAIGVTMVILTGGIDLSVGSLIALSSVVTAVLIRDVAGGQGASTGGMILCCLAGIAVCAAVGLFDGAMVTFFDVPPFIATLAMLLVGSGLAYLIAAGQSIQEVPDSFVWLGRGRDLLGIPNAVVMTAVLYAAAHVLMTQTKWGRYVYAVGGNAEAARLSGVPVRRVKLFVYAASGALAGLGGIVTASQLKSGSPKFGPWYELYAIAAVVVGGTSLSGGQGKILGTLIGALIIAVIWNGMNLTDVESYTQKVVLGAVILGAVLLDRLKNRSWNLLRRKRPA